MVKRIIEIGYERVQCQLPALLTTVSGDTPPRYPDVARLLFACKKKAPIKIWNAADIGVNTADIGLDGSLTHVIKTFAPKLDRKGEILQGDPETVARELVSKLDSENLV